jgi:hypothetical protein
MRTQKHPGNRPKGNHCFAMSAFAVFVLITIFQITANADASTLE